MVLALTGQIKPSVWPHMGAELFCSEKYDSSNATLVNRSDSDAVVEKTMLVLR